MTYLTARVNVGDVVTTLVQFANPERFYELSGLGTVGKGSLWHIHACHGHFREVETSELMESEIGTQQLGNWTKNTSKIPGYGSTCRNISWILKN